MIDIKIIRNDPKSVIAMLEHRMHPDASNIVNTIIELDEHVRKHKTLLQDMQMRKNTIAEEMAQKRNPDLIKEGAAIKDEIEKIKSILGDFSNKLDNMMDFLPNMIAKDLPIGIEPLVMKTWGTIRQFSFAPKNHYELFPEQMDFEKAAMISGSRFVILRGFLAKLERAIANFMIDTHVRDFGYEEISVPVIVKTESLYGTSNLPKFAEDLFKLSEDKWLIPTAETSLTNIARNTIFSESDLPLRMTAYTQCFRSEAGSAGKDTRGMIRMHQFPKVELVSIVSPESSYDEHERMTMAAETILEKLQLPYRRVLLGTADIGFQSFKTYDLEVWLPGANEYREISSCSNCIDFQARRMKARFRASKSFAQFTSDKEDLTHKTETDSDSNARSLFVHTLNGSGLAVGRTLIAVLENYQQSDGSIKVPEVLLKYMQG